MRSSERKPQGRLRRPRRKAALERPEERHVQDKRGRQSAPGIAKWHSSAQTQETKPPLAAAEPTQRIGRQRHNGQPAVQARRDGNPAPRIAPPPLPLPAQQPSTASTTAHRLAPRAYSLSARSPDTPSPPTPKPTARNWRKTCSSDARLVRNWTWAGIRGCWEAPARAVRAFADDCPARNRKQNAMPEVRVHEAWDRLSRNAPPRSERGRHTENRS